MIRRCLSRAARAAHVPRTLVLASLLLAAVWLALPDPALAAPTPSVSPPALVVRDQTTREQASRRDIEGGIKSLFTKISTLGVNVVGAVFTAVAVIGGLLIITAGSNSRRSETGQAFLWSGVIGVFIVLMAATFSEELITLFSGQ